MPAARRCLRPSRARRSSVPMWGLSAHRGCSCRFMREQDPPSAWPSCGDSNASRLAGLKTGDSRRLSMLEVRDDAPTTRAHPGDGTRECAERRASSSAWPCWPAMRNANYLEPGDGAGRFGHRRRLVDPSRISRTSIRAAVAQPRDTAANAAPFGCAPHKGTRRGPGDRPPGRPRPDGHVRRPRCIAAVITEDGTWAGAAGIDGAERTQGDTRGRIRRSRASPRHSPPRWSCGWSSRER